MRLGPPHFGNRTSALAAALTLALLAGCALQPRPLPVAPGSQLPMPGPAAPRVPSELNRVALPTYRIEPPDTLEIDAQRVVPKNPYRISALDYLGINVYPTLPGQPITGSYGVEPGGTVSLGAAYGRIHVAGMTLEEASEAINKQLSRVLANPETSVTLVASDSLEHIQGQHRVGPDGTVNLGMYGEVYVTGLTVEEGRKAIEAHLSQFLDDPSVSVDIYSYASKFYYLIAQGAGTGDTLAKIPVTGSETVLDAIATQGFISRVSSTQHIWIARPTPGCCDQILNVNWKGITQGAATATNYQIMPGDRVYIAEDKMVALDSFITKITSPIQRLLGFTTLGVQTVATTQHPGLSLTNGGGGVQ